MSYPSKTEFDNLRNSLPLTYQTRGNYAFRTDLASNINTALRNVNTALAFYAKKTDIPIVPANVATKTDLAGYALASDLSKYQPAGRYVSPSELEAYQAKGDYALAKDLVSYAKSSDLVNFQPKGEYALATDLASYAKESSLASYQPKGDYAVKSDLGGYQPKGDYALAADLTSYAKESSLASYQPKGDYAVKSDLVGYQPKGDYAVKSDLASYQPKGDYALQTDLVGYQPKGNYQTAGNYALKTELANYALAKDFANLQPKGNYQTAGNYALQTDLAGYQPKGNYQTAGNYALQPTAGNYALQSELAGYVKTAGASTFSGQATFDKNAIVKTEGTTPFQVLGTGGLRVSGGNLTVTGAQATFENNATVTTSAGKPFEVKGAGGIDVDSISIAAAGYITGKGRLHITGPELLYVLNKNGLVIGKERDGNGNLDVQGDTTIRGNASIAGSLSANHVFLESGGDPSLRLGPSIKDIGNARLNVQDKAGTYMRFFYGPNETGSITHESDSTSLNVGKVNSTNLSTTNASITNLTIGNFNMTGAPTFGALATFKSNAIVETTEGKPFQVTGKGGLRVTGGNFTVTGPGDGVGTNGSLLVSGIDAFGHALYVASSSANGKRIGFQRTANEGSIFAYDYGGGVPQNLILQGPGGNVGIGTASPSAKLHVAGSAIVEGASTFKEQATFEKNATVTTTANNPFNVTGAGGLVVTGGNLTVSGDTSINGNSNVGNQHVRGIFPAPKTDSQGLHFQWNRSGNEGESWIINNPGLGGANAGIRFGKSDAKNVVTEFGRFNNSGAFSVEGSSTFKGASTFNAQATFEKNATVTTTANNPFQVKGDGGLNVTGEKLKLGNATFHAHPTDTWVRMSADNGTSYNYGLAAKNLWTDGTLDAKTANVSGNASIAGSATFKGASTFNAQATFEKNATVTTTANNPFQVKGDGGLKIAAGGLVVGGEANVTGNVVVSNDLHLGGKNSWIMHTPEDWDRTSLFIAPINPANNQWNWGAQTEFLNDGGLNVNKINVNSARFNTTGATTFFPGHTLALDSAGVVGGSFIVKSDATKGNTKVGINNENPTSSLDVVGNATISGGNDSDIKTPNGKLKMNQYGIMLGGNNKEGRETNSAQISAGIHIPNSLNIVGMSSGKESNDRKVDIWAEGGLNVYGSGKFSTTNPGDNKQRDILKWGLHTNAKGEHLPYLQIGNWVILEEAGGNLTFYKNGNGAWIQDNTGVQRRLNH